MISHCYFAHGFGRFALCGGFVSKYSRLQFGVGFERQNVKVAIRNTAYTYLLGTGKQKRCANHFPYIVSACSITRDAAFPLTRERIYHVCEGGKRAPTQISLINSKCVFDNAQTHLLRIGAAEKPLFEHLP